MSEKVFLSAKEREDGIYELMGDYWVDPEYLMDEDKVKKLFEYRGRVQVDFYGKVGVRTVDAYGLPGMALLVDSTPRMEGLDGDAYDIVPSSRDESEDDEDESPQVEKIEPATVVGPETDDDGNPLWDDDGVCTPAGEKVMKDYARRFIVDNVRDLEAERRFPDFSLTFHEIRNTRYGFYLLGMDDDEPRPATASEKLVSKAIQRERQEDEERE